MLKWNQNTGLALPLVILAIIIGALLLVAPKAIGPIVFIFLAGGVIGLLLKFSGKPPPPPWSGAKDKDRDNSQ